MTQRLKARLPRQMLGRALGQRGFTLIEMAIVLLIAGLLVAGITQMMASSQKNRGDQAVANEVRTVTNAMERFLVDYQAGLAQYGITTSGNAFPMFANNVNQGLKIDNKNTDAMTAFATYLPAGFSMTPYTIGVKRQDVNGRPSFRALILRVPDSTMDDSRLSRVASLIGTQGGMLSNTFGSSNINGVMGTWSVANATVYSLTAPALGMIASLTNTVDAQISVNTLARINPAGTGQSEGNTMRTDLYMGDGQPAGVGQPITGAYRISNVSSVGFVMLNMAVGASCDSGTAEVYAADETDLGQVTLDATMHNRIFFGFQYTGNPSADLLTVKLYQCTASS